MNQWTRRKFMQTSMGGAIATGAGPASPRLASAADAGAEDVRIERLADRIMGTEPVRIVDFILTQLRAGLSRQQLLAASFNAGARLRGHHQGYVAHPIRVISDEIDARRSLLPLFYYQSSAASIYVLQGSDMEDNRIVRQARDALKL